MSAAGSAGAAAAQPVKSVLGNKKPAAATGTSAVEERSRNTKNFWMQELSHKKKNFQQRKAADGNLSLHGRDANEKRFLAVFMILVMGCALTARDEEGGGRRTDCGYCFRSRRGKLVNLLVSLWK